MRMCAELADLAMQLARAAAARTLTDWAEPEQPPPADPHVAQAAAAQVTNPAEPPLIRSAEPPTDRQTAPRANSARTATPKQTDPAVLFTRFAAIVRDCIALESRLAAGLTNAPTTGTRVSRADPSRAPLRDALHAAAENHPDGAELRSELIARLDEHLAANPGQTIDPADLLEKIGEEFGLEIAWATIRDELRVAAAPEPHATSPP